MNTVLGKPTTGGIIAISTLALGALVGARYLSTRKVSSAERLCDALLDTEPLREAARDMADRPEARLATCASYFVDVAYRSADGWGIGTGANDPIGYARMKTHRYTQGAASVLTESHLPDHVLNYTLNVPDIAEVRGVRRHGPLSMDGLLPAYAVPETAQISLHDGYTAQVEADLHVTEAFVTGKARMYGAVTLRDSDGNVGRLNVGTDGIIHGTITHQNRVVGRFDGRLGSDVAFKPYQIEPGDN
ncbi:MAG TPA: hypothetical protein VKT77_00840 [Chthonomonadaceae bacterium]|nr:hypothetical protein [Chthonomonadaceae bacterium]